MRGAGKGRREEVLTGGAGLSAEAAAERERTGAEWAAVRAGTGMCGAGCGLGRLKEGWPGISACARGKEIPGDLAGRFGRGCVEPGREGGRRS